MVSDFEKRADGELRLRFADGSSFPFAVRELVDTIRHRTVMSLTCLFAVLLALPGGGAFSEEVPLWARIGLNLFSVGIFAVLFPALLQEAHSWASRRAITTVFEPLITVPTALITTLAVEALAVFVVGEQVLTRGELAMKLGFGAMFWELHITMMLLFMGPALRAQQAVDQAVAVAAPAVPEVPIGNLRFPPGDVLRIETDDHFLIIHTATGTTRVLASMNDAQQELAGFGLQVHRRHWVAFGELGEVRRSGRSYLMRTRSGSDIAVSRERRKAVETAAERNLTP